MPLLRSRFEVLFEDARAMMTGTNDTHSDTFKLPDDFLLGGAAVPEATVDVARRLYQRVRRLPIIDFHTHLAPKDIAADRRYENVSRLLIKDGREGDHYIWSLMGRAGVEEHYITGGASDEKRFFAFARVFPLLRDNPCYHWTLMALQDLFGVCEELNERNAAKVWSHCNERLKSPEYSMRSLLIRNNVEVVCTTDDPTDCLSDHVRYRDEAGSKPAMLPTWRPDAAMNIEKPSFIDWVSTLAGVSGVEISGLDSLLHALTLRADFFVECGCRASDFGLDSFFTAPYNDAEVDAIIRKRLAGYPLSDEGSAAYKSCLLYHLLCMCQEKGWVQQLHVGPVRNVNSFLFDTHGLNAGGDTVGNEIDVERAGALLDRLHRAEKLGKTILYCINPNDTVKLEALAGRFNRGKSAGKIFAGVPWWFNDHDSGMLQYFETVRAQGLLSKIPGMVSDSRSVLSSYRFDYFRRVLCRFSAECVARGYPPLGTAEGIEERGRDLERICFGNAKELFGW